MRISATAGTRLTAPSLKKPASFLPRSPQAILAASPATRKMTATSGKSTPCSAGMKLEEKMSKMPAPNMPANSARPLSIPLSRTKACPASGACTPGARPASAPFSGRASIFFA